MFIIFNILQMGGWVGPPASTPAGLGGGPLEVSTELCTCDCVCESS